MAAVLADSRGALTLMVGFSIFFVVKELKEDKVCSCVLFCFSSSELNEKATQLLSVFIVSTRRLPKRKVISISTGYLMRGREKMRKTKRSKKEKKENSSFHCVGMTTSGTSICVVFLCERGGFVVVS